LTKERKAGTKKNDDRWLNRALEIQRQCEEGWLRDVGEDSPVVNYETGQQLGTAKEILERHRRNRRG